MTTIIAHQLDPADAARLQLPADTRLVACDPANPWTMPSGATGLLLGNPAWQLAPDTPTPPGWPGSIDWVQFRSTGIDRYPEWLLSLPHVTTARGAQAPAIAEWVLGVMLDFEKHPERTRVKSRAGWTRTEPLGTLSGKVLGLVGLGHIGAETARRALPFGMRVLAARRSAAAGPEGVEVVPLPEVLASADHLLICAPLTPATQGLIGAEALAQVKPGLHLINVARGALLVEAALRPALDDGRVGRASLDVTEPEPPPDGHWLYAHPSVWLTPHLSFLGPATQARTEAIIAANIRLYVAGRTAEMHGHIHRGQGY